MSPFGTRFLFGTLGVAAGAGLFLSRRSFSRTLCQGANSDELVAFSKKEWRKFRVNRISDISHNTKEFNLNLPSPLHETGVVTASCIMIKGPPSGEKDVTRPYTPTSLNTQKGTFDLVIKSYPQGVVSKYMHSLKVGDYIEVKGPFEKIKYTANMKREIGMICGGTGITPMLQVIKEILSNPADKTTIHLLFANNAEDDILLKPVLDELAREHPKQFRVTYILSTPSDAWSGFRGFISKPLAMATMPLPASDILIMVCGPPGMMKAVSGDKTPDYKQGEVEGILKEIGYTKDMVFKF